MPSFVEIGPTVPEKRFFTIYGQGGHLGHVILIIHIHIGSPHLPKDASDLALTSQDISEKKIFKKI